MKIITVNLPQTYIKIIEDFIGENALYPSRSELIRVAVREFLIRELSAAEQFKQTYLQSKPVLKQPEPTIDPNLFVQIPVGKSNGTPEFKTFKLGRKDPTDTQNVEFDDYVERNDKSYSQNKWDRNITPKLKTIEPPVLPHVPQMLVKPEEINLGGRILKVIKR